MGGLDRIVGVTKGLLAGANITYGELLGPQIMYKGGNHGKKSKANLKPEFI